jgi:hypothetical protein
MAAVKNIRVYFDTYERLGKIGNYGDTMDTIVNRLLDFYEKNGGKQ